MDLHNLYGINEKLTILLFNSLHYQITIASQSNYQRIISGIEKFTRKIIKLHSNFKVHFNSLKMRKNHINAKFQSINVYPLLLLLPFDSPLIALCHKSAGHIFSAPTARVPFAPLFGWESAHRYLL